MTLWLPIAIGLSLILLVQVPAAVSLLKGLWRRPTIAEGPWPKAAAILCVRGADETLARCLEGLLAQDYPDYGVVVIVDREADPGWGIVKRVSDQFPRVPVRVEVLGQRLETCSLKCSALIQAVAGLEESVAIVALIDADTVPHATWLKELAAPLNDAKIGAAAGVRWYMPDNPTWGAIVRYVWNVPAIASMQAFGIAWGGSLAFRRDAIVKANLPEKWARAYCEDTMTRDALEPAGLKLAYVPTLIMVHRDDCRVGEFTEWCVRQMLTSRLYHRSWRLIVAHGFATTQALVISLGAMLGATVSISLGAMLGATVGIPFEVWNMVWLMVAIIAAFWFIQWAALLVIEKSVQRKVASRGESTAWLSPLTLLKLAIAVPLTQAIYFHILIATLGVRRVRWRGVTYDIAGPWDVRRRGGEPEPVAAPER